MKNKKYKQNPKIVVSPETKQQLDNLGNKGMTYNDILQALINKYNYHIMSQEELNEVDNKLRELEIKEGEENEKTNIK